MTTWCENRLRASEREREREIDRERDRDRDEGMCKERGEEVRRTRMTRSGRDTLGIRRPRGNNQARADPRHTEPRASVEMVPPRPRFVAKPARLFGDMCIKHSDSKLPSR